jgi:site-specific DNA-methyltransferase (adenine-specific)
MGKGGLLMTGVMQQESLGIDGDATLICGHNMPIMALNPDMFRDQVALVITSPPYNVGIDYGEGTDDSRTYEEYLDWLNTWCYRLIQSEWLKTGARICVNVPVEVSRPSRQPLASDLTHVMKQHFIYNTTILWLKENNSSPTAWGSFASASDPWVSNPTEVILVFSHMQRKREDRGESTIDKKTFMDLVRGVWRIQPATKLQWDHPAPFPIELPRKLIQLYSYKGDTVLDPFAGSFTTSVAARQEQRRSIGIELNPEYYEMGIKRLQGQAQRLLDL